MKSARSFSWSYTLQGEWKVWFGLFYVSRLLMPNSVVWINNVNVDIGSGYTKVQNIDMDSDCSVVKTFDICPVSTTFKMFENWVRFRRELVLFASETKKADIILLCMRFKKVEIDRVCTWFKKGKMDPVYSRAKKGRYRSGLHRRQKC